MRMRNIMKRISLLSLALVFSCGAVASALSPEQKRVIQSGSDYFNVEATLECSIGLGRAQGGKLATGSRVYMLGDSITNGASQKYRTAFSAKGITPYINAVGGRAWTYSGSGSSGAYTPEAGGAQKGSEAVEADAAEISGSNGIIIALGSNGALGANPITDMVAAIRSKNPSAPIWWVNVVASDTNTIPSVTSYGEFNDALEAQEPAIAVIDWHGTVIPGSNPGDVPTATVQDPSSYLSSDGLHPTSAGANALVGLVVGNVTEASSGNPVFGGGCVCQSNVSSTLNGNDNIEKSYNYFVQKGLAPAQSAGIVGNIIRESGGDPTITNSIGAHGLVQWLGGRLDNERKWVGEQGKDPDSLDGQLDFIWYEATERGDMDDIRATTTAAESATVWNKVFEISGEDPAKRIAHAEQVLAKYGNGATGGSLINTSSQNCSGLTGAGENTRFIDGFTIYSQYDPAWIDKPYGTSTVGDSGCGPAALAMVITTLTGQRVTPADTATYAAVQGMYTEGTGSSWAISEIVASHWGLNAQAITADVATITAALQGGALIVTSGRGPKPFTTAGHFIVIRGVTADGKFKIGDSAHDDTNDQEWDPAQLLANMNAGNVYAITK